MSERPSGSRSIVKIRSDVTTDTLYAGPSQTPAPADPLLGARTRSGSDIAAQVKALDAARQAQGDSIELSDGYIRTATEYGAHGPEGFNAMMYNLNQAIDVRTNVLEANDPLLGTTYRYAYNVSAGKVPPEASIIYLKNSMHVWEQLATQTQLPAFVTDHYLNTGYKNLSLLYQATNQAELAAQATSKIRK